MVFAGSGSFKDAFSNFGSTPAMLVFGMVIIIDAIIDSGVITEFEYVLMKMTRHGEKTFLVLILLSAGVISVFSNNTALVAMFMPFIASVAETTHGRIQKKHIYLPLAVGGLIGGTGSLAGSTAPLLASEVLKITGQKQFAFFTTAPVAMTILLVVALCYWLFLYDLQVKWFDFPETGNEKPERPPSTLEPMIDMDEDLAVIRALGIADGFVKSGAGDLVIGFLVNTFGPAMTDPKVMVALFLVSGWIISNFMSNGSLVSMLASVAVPMAIEYGINPEPVAIACCIGASMAFATPVATTTVTMVQIAGYRFKDYLRVGGLIGLIGVVAAWTVIVLMYGL
jgi:di/tricarboxylate transporter